MVIPHLLLLLVSICFSIAKPSYYDHYSPILSKIDRGVKAFTYSYRVYHNTDRGFEPLTIEMCNTDHNFKDLQSCLLAQGKNRKLLRKYSQTYLNRDTNYWSFKTRRDVVRNVNSYYSHIYSKRNRSFRFKRSAPLLRTYKKNNDVDDEKILRRSKREIPGNPCVMGEEKRTIIYHALDAETEGPMELLQDPVGNKYQTFYTRYCVKEVFDAYHCEISFATHIAAVFDKASGYVINRPVKIPTTCVMTVPGMIKH